jgi:polyhydroxyalkanoate synthesis regulator phasin
MLDAAADYLGVTQAELREALRDEQSLADVARAKGKSVDGLKAAMIKGVKADLDEAVEDGDITREHADQLVEKLSGEIDRLVEGRVPSPRPFGRGFGFGFGFGGGGDLFEAAADYLGLTEAQLRDELSDGDSLEDVAKAKGKSVDGLKTAMRSALKAELDEEVEEGDITREQANELLDDLSDVIDEAIAGDFRGFGFHMKFRGGPGAGFDFEFGVRPDAGFPDILPAPEPAFDIEVEKLQTF